MDSIVKATSYKDVGIYSGDIKVKVVDKKGNQKGKTKVLHNKGRWPLFQFFTTCLASDYNTAENLRPKYVKLFYTNQRDIPEITDDQGSAVLTEYLTNEKSLVTYTYSTAPTITSVDDMNVNLGQSTITYKFLIPFTHINTDEGINVIGLYNSQNYNNPQNPSAYFFVPDEENQTQFGNLLADGSGVTNKNYNLIIEWTLVLKNVQGE